jgi:hypothetical protein
MQADNTTENVLRFLQIRPAAAMDSNGGPTEMAEETDFARRMAPATPAERRKYAVEALEGEQLSEFLATDVVERLVAAVQATLAREGSVADLAAAVGPSTEELKPVRERASDLLLAVKFASTGPPGLRAVDATFRGASALLARAGNQPLDEVMRRPLALPWPSPLARGPRGELPGPVPSRPSRDLGHAKPASPIHDTMDELVALARPDFVNAPDEDAVKPTSEPSFALNGRGRERLSDGARAVLKDLGVDLETDSLDNLIQLLEEAATRVRREVATLEAPPPDPPEEYPYLRDVGVADLLVVKQHLKAYERADIAHVENVLAGETKSRTHRALERTEETITIERETIQERETELETAERFELNREMARTVQRDQEFGFNLTVSGKYGPTVEFSSSLEAGTSTSTEDSASSATRYAKDVVERSLERVVERVREEQVRKILREEEETNLHELKNATAEHISGVYQFLEKDYESQIFNYGIRQMFDFMVPEPASYLWYLEGSEADLNLPTPPPRLDDYALDASAVNSGNFIELAARFKADGVEPPPPIVITSASTIMHGQDAPDDGEEGHPRSVVEEDLAVPEGYRPYRALVRPLALTDDQLTLAITVGHTRRVWIPLGSQIDIGEDHELGTEAIDLFLLPDSNPYEPQSKLPLQVVAFETNSYAVAVEVIFLRTSDAYQKWQIKTYDKLAAAHRDSVERYEATVADLKAAAEAEKANSPIRFGAPPSQNLKTIKAELKKHCISIVTRQRYESFDMVEDGDPPYFDFDVAAERGSFTRFFEQAFEWDQLQYVFYPYYWSRADRWAKRFLRQEVDPLFLEFLQAGAARVVVPVRPGFELALTHYLETGEIYNGEGDPPIHDPLYVPIVTEIQERTGGPQDELPVGEPWLTRVPTPVAIVRQEDTLPAWERLDPSGWDWQEI